MLRCYQTWLFLVTSHLLLQHPTVVLSQVTDPTSVSVGDTVCFEGYIMDNFCIERGTLFDRPSVTTLENPELHSVHCLVDITPCIESNWEILIDPTVDGELYGRAFQFVDTSKAGLRVLAQSVGARRPDDPSVFRCSTCTEEMGMLETGFRAEIRGTVVTARNGDTPPTVEITSVMHSNDSTNICDLTEELTPMTELLDSMNELPTTSNTNDDDDDDIAIKVVSGLAVAAMAIVAILSMFGLLKKPEQQK